MSLSTLQKDNNSLPLHPSLLLAALIDLVEWHAFGTLLKIPQEVLRKLDEEHPRSVSRKLTEVVHYWLEHDPEASWDKVIEALRAIPQEKHVLDIVLNKFVPKGPPTAMPVKVLSLQESDKLALTLDEIQTKFAGLVTDIQNALEKESEFKTIYRFITNFLQDTFQPKRDPEDITQLFICLQSHYCFMNYKILKKIVYQFVKDRMGRDLNKYDKDVRKWLQSTTVQEFKAAIEKAAKATAGADQLSDLCIVQLKLEGEWFKVTIKNLWKLLKYIFGEKSSIFTRITIDEGSVIVQMVAPRSEILSLITLASRKHKEMEFIGIIYIQVENLVLPGYSFTEFSFHQALISSFQQRCSPQLIEFMLKLKVISDSHSFNIVLGSIYYNNIEALSLLIKHAFDFQSFDSSGVTSAIHIGAITGSSEAVELLINAGVSPDHHHPEKKWTPLIAAVNFKQESIVKVLLQHHAKADFQEKEGFSPLGIACGLGNKSIASLLLEAGADPNLKVQDGCTALYLASSLGYHEIVKLLLNFNADPNIQCDDNASPLLIATSFKQKKVVKLLLHSGAYVDLQGDDSWYQQAPLHCAAADNETELMNLLLNANANVNIPNDLGIAPMHFTCYNGNEEMAQRFLDAGADVNLCSHTGESPLHAAIYGDNTKIAKMLLDAGADPNFVSTTYATPLHMACNIGNADIVLSLLKAKANIDALDSDEHTPLTIAAAIGHTEIVKMLLAAGASTELTNDNNGWTPIFFATAGGHLEIVKLLLKHKAVIKEDLHGKTPQFVAASMGRVEVKTILHTAAPPEEIQPVVNTDDLQSSNIISYYNGCIASLSSTLTSAKQYFRNVMKRIETKIESSVPQMAQTY